MEVWILYFLLHQLFVQRLPANFQMGIAPDNASIELEQIADMADTVMKVATPMISAVSNIHIYTSCNC